MTKRVVILGATSAIARATSAALAKNGYALTLAGRDVEELARIASDLSLRHGAEVGFSEFDADRPDEHEAFVKAIIAETGGFYGVVLAFGYLGDNELAATDSAEATRIMSRNLTGAVSVLTHCAEHLRERGEGCIVGLSSVAGDRGRQSNYIYGAAKAGLSTYLQGLRNRLHPAGVRVTTVKPGFVDTAMTFGMDGLFLVASPEYVGERIARLLEKRAKVVYLPWFWRYIMWIIRCIPEFLFKRLKL